MNNESITNEQVNPVLIVDADDTLWETEIYYDQCIADFVALMESQGFEQDEAREVLGAVERERVPEVGYAPEEFARSLVIAYERLCERRGYSADEEVAEAIWDIGQTVVDYPIVLLDGVEETLSQLAERCRLLLLTKGDRDTQEDKLARSGLEHHFDGVHVVHEKDADVVRRLLERYDLQPEQAWVVGNSPRSDVNPALEAGVGAIHLPHSNTWDFEQEEILNPERVVTLDSFGELPEVLDDKKE